MNIEDLIKEGEHYGATITRSPVPSNVIGIGRWYYDIPDNVGYWAWTNKCIIFLRQKGNLEESKEIKKYADKKNSWELKDGYDQIMSILKAVKEFLSEDKGTLENKSRFDKNKVFIVHGHNEVVNQEVARTLEKIGLEAIILREQPNSGQTIIEKFESYANTVNFAVILLTADDQMPETDIYRARQNVIFEMGYFMGALGRSHVMCLLQDKVEKPGDIDGVVYTSIDNVGVWKFSLVKELKNAGYKVSADQLL